MRWRSSALGLVTAAAVLFGQLWTVVHLLIVEHRQCPEHGELVHAAPVRGANDAPRQTAALLPVDSDSSHSHAHCLCVMSRREAALARSTAADTPAVADATSTVAIGMDRPVACRRWILAPKNSPPRPV